MDMHACKRIAIDECVWEHPIDWIPGMKNMRLRDLPNFFRITGSDHTSSNFTADAIDRTGDAAATIVHTFKVLESDVFCTLSSMIPKVCTIGSLHLMIDRIARDELSQSTLSAIS